MPASLKQDIEMGMKRSASMARIKSAKCSNTTTPVGSHANLVALAAANSTTNRSLNGHTNGNGNGVHAPGHQNGFELSSYSSALPFEPMCLSFQDVGYSVPVAKNIPTSDSRIQKEGPHAGQLQLLHDISGSFRPGVLTALMGASGAGKTTLMDVLAGRKTGGKITGDIRLNGHPKEQTTFARISAYVEQDDSHLAECTVAEALEFSAALRLPTSVSVEDRRKFVDEVRNYIIMRM